MPYVDNDIPLAPKRKWDRDPNDDEPCNSKSSQRNLPSPREASVPVDAPISPPATRKTLHPAKRHRSSIRHDSVNDVHSSYHRPFAREPPITITGALYNAGKVSSTVLLPCHVCHRRPTKKSDLDSFARCQSYREQTCFICMRECQGRTSSYTESEWRKDDEGDEEALSRSFHMHDADAVPSIPHADYDDIDVDVGDDDLERKRGIYTHRSMICSRCCVEKGAEGEVVCLGCLSDPYTNPS
ncbi:hypothetical protein J3F83DRAFT_753698 [Trichoderma novae-zelandiae]